MVGHSLRLPVDSGSAFSSRFIALLVLSLDTIHPRLSVILILFAGSAVASLASVVQVKINYVDKPCEECS